MAVARLDSLDRALTIANSRGDSLDIKLWKCEAIKPEPRSVFDSFEVGILAGVGLTVLTIAVLGAQLK